MWEGDAAEKNAKSIELIPHWNVEKETGMKDLRRVQVLWGWSGIWKWGRHYGI
jgi:hypothetical protein